VVVTQIAAQAPLLGPHLTRLLGGEGAVGVVTFARFYGVHVLLLPPATMALIAGHLYLVRKHGVAPIPADENLPTKHFHPGQTFKDTVAIFIAFAILFTMAVAARVPLEQLADPSDTTYIPRPEWYFLFLFQTLKLFSGPLEVLGAVVLPGLAVLALILVPFIDRGRMVKVTRRVTAFAFVALAAIGWTGLTATAIATTPHPDQAAQIDYSGPTEWLQLSPGELAGVAWFRQEKCADCHVIGREGTGVGPDLTRISIHKDAAWMIEHFEHPAAVRPGSSMPPIQLSGPQLNSLAAFLLRLNPRNASALQDAPDFAAKGAAVYQASHCDMCHKVNAVGMMAGPPLNGLSKRRSRRWVEMHFGDPQKLVPGSAMPAYKLPAQDMENLTSYLFSLPEQ
jgi:ubiquinol-cytochrome c reductase cytochrome b subunit